MSEYIKGYYEIDFCDYDYQIYNKIGKIDLGEIIHENI